ncbi:MAG: alpha/beta hydrolase [Verrucomicrobiota bacterium]
MKKHLIAVGLFVSALCGWDAAAAAPQFPPIPSPMFPFGENVEVLRDVEIGTGGGRPLRVMIARPKNPPVSPTPAVLWIHGGGWESGSHRLNPAAPLASKGYFTASIEYRLSGEAKWPAQIEDCKLAVRWLRANAAKYNVDPNRIGCWGHSAGGHLAVCLGTMGEQAALEGKGGFAGVSSRVQAVVDYCGPVDFTRGSQGITGAVTNDAPVLVKLFGGTFKDMPDTWRNASPIIYASAKSAPCLIVQGDKDTLVPMAQSESLFAAMKKAGAPVELIVIKNGGHGLKEAPGDPPAEPNQKAIQAAVQAFFDTHLKAK